MKKVLLLILVLSTICFTSKGQESANNISGKVVDSSNTPIVGVVILMFDSDSTYVNSTMTDVDGLFNLKVKTIPYRLIFQHLSYEQQTLNSSVNDIGVITLGDNVMHIQEVVVRGERPIVKVEDGKLAYNLEVIAQNRNVNNAYEAITKIPGVRENDGQLELVGAGALNVIINGKPSTMTAEQLATILKSTPVERVEKAEVMYSTPPQYHLRGASVNLVLKRSYDYSFAGEVHGNYINKHKNSWDVGGNFVFSSPKWNGDVTYSGGEIANITQVELLSRHTLGDKIYNISQNQELNNAAQRHNIRAALEYAPEGKSSLSVVYTSELYPKITKSTDATGSFVNSTSRANGDNSMHNIALKYRSTFGLDMGVDYTYYNTSNSSLISNNYNSGNLTTFNVQSHQTINKIRSYIDGSSTLGKGWNITYGANFDYTHDVDFQHYNIIEGDLPVVNTDYKLQEWTANVYGGFSKPLSKGNVSLSVAGEYYQLGDYKKWNIYPQASFVWQFDERNLVQLSFSSDKVYPSYWEMQESVTYLDGYSEIYGNINLRPMQKYSAQAVYMLKSKYLFVLFWNEMPDYFEQTAYQSPDRLALIYQTLNWDFSRQYGFNISIPFRAGEWLDSRATFTGLNMRQKSSSFYDLSFDRSKLVGVVQLDNSIKILKKPDITLDISGYYQTAAIQGTYDTDPSWGVDAGVKWQFAKGKATISAKCTDIFNTTIPFTRVRFEHQNLDMASGAFSRTFTLHFAYRFGSYKEKSKDKVDTSRFGH